MDTGAIITSSSPNFLPRETFTSVPLFSVPRNVQCHNVVAFTDLTLLWLFAKITVANRSICVSHKICATFPLSVPLLPGWQPFSYVSSVSQCFWAKAGPQLSSVSQCLAPVGLAEAAACSCGDASAEADFQTFLSAWDTSFKLWSYCYIVRKKGTQSMTFLSDGSFTFALSIFEVWTCCY